MRGKISLILGSMKSGKSNALLSRVNLAKYAKKKCVYVRPAIDDREMISRDAENSNLTALRVDNFIDCFGQLYCSDYDLILIDEAQFFETTLCLFAWDLAASGKEVMVAGLCGDSDLNEWPTVSKMIPYVDSITKLDAVCENCFDDSRATFSFTRQKKDSQIVIGDSEYLALCRECYIGLRAEDELRAARKEA